MIVTYERLYRRYRFASQRDQPVVVMPDEVDYLADNLSIGQEELIGASLDDTVSERHAKAVAWVKRGLAAGDSRLFGHPVVLGPLRARNSDTPLPPLPEPLTP